ncbi:MAG: hypothetical protein JWM03_1218 [Rhodocyclales bacterium]|nr:hypothetical protein [Rhodocyclales bacterium]
MNRVFRTTHELRSKMLDDQTLSNRPRTEGPDRLERPRFATRPSEKKKSQRSASHAR